MTGIFTVTLTVQGIDLRGNPPDYLPGFFCYPRLPDDMVRPRFFADKCSLRSMNKGVSSLDHRDKVMTEKR